MTNWICTHCGIKIRFWISLCNKCKDEKLHSTAILHQNKAKLKILLKEPRFSVERFDKFILYTNNIIRYWKILVKYKEEETIRTFERLKKWWILD